MMNKFRKNAGVSASSSAVANPGGGCNFTISQQKMQHPIMLFARKLRKPLEPFKFSLNNSIQPHVAIIANVERSVANADAMRYKCRLTNDLILTRFVENNNFGKCFFLNVT